MDRCVVKHVETLRSEELFILDSLHSAVWKSAFPETDDDIRADEDEDEKPTRKKKQQKLNLFAIDRLLAISEARRQLMGLDVKPDAIPDGVTIIREYGVEVSKV